MVRLSVEPDEARRTPPQFTTTAHLALESRVLDCIDELIARGVPTLEAATVERAISADRLGDDQGAAVHALCAAGPALRTMLAPPGYGKTTAVHAAAAAAVACGRPVLGVATTNRAAAELRDVGLPAVTIARLTIDLEDRPLAPGTIVVLDETSQTSTVDARDRTRRRRRRRRAPSCGAWVMSAKPKRSVPAGWPPSWTASPPRTASPPPR